MTIEQVKKAEKIGDVFTVDEFMGEVGCGFLPCDGSGVFVFKEDTEIPSCWDRTDRSVWSVLKVVRKFCRRSEGEIIGWKTVRGGIKPKRAHYKVVGYKLSKKLKDQIECVCWYNI